MNLRLQFKQDQALMSFLKVNTMAHLIGKTDKGSLMLQIDKNKTIEDYRIVLDSVPLAKKESDEIIVYLCKEEVPEVKKEPELPSFNKPEQVIPTEAPKKRGRPKKVE